MIVLILKVFMQHTQHLFHQILMVLYKYLLFQLFRFHSGIQVLRVFQYVPLIIFIYTGLNNAGSIRSGRLVAANTKTPFRFSSTPSR